MPIVLSAPQFLWLLLAIPLVIALHFIRQRKKRTVVSALFLWQKAQALAQQRRRFSPTWLLLSQLLFVSLLALALAQPRWQRPGGVARVLIIDAAASMTAQDNPASGRQRLDEARERAEALLEDAGSVALIRAGLDATLLQAMTDDHNLIRQALAAVQAGDERGDVARAIALAQSIAPEAEIHLFSDREVRRNGAQLHNVAGEGHNLGISAFELRAQQAFVSVVNSHPRPQEVPLTLVRAGQTIAQTSLLVPADGQAHVSFPIEGQAGFYRASIDVPAWDALALDNVAYAGNRSLQVWLSPLSAPLERALLAIPGLDLRVSARAPITAANYDVLVSVAPMPEPESLPPGRYLFFSPASEDPEFQRIAEWDRADPLLRFVDLQAATVGIDPQAPPLTEDNWQVLARTARLEPAIARWRDAERDIISMRFHPNQTDIIRRAAFPILMANISETFRQASRLPLGSPLASSSDVLRDGESQQLSRLLEPGVYSIDGTNYTVSLLSAAASRIPVAPEGVQGPADSQSPVASVVRQEREQDVALWLALLGLLVLVAEWLLWSRSSRSWASQR